MIFRLVTSMKAIYELRTFYVDARFNSGTTGDNLSRYKDDNVFRSFEREQDKPNKMDLIP